MQVRFIIRTVRVNYLKRKNRKRSNEVDPENKNFEFPLDEKTGNPVTDFTTMPKKTNPTENYEKLTKNSYIWYIYTI